MKIGEALKYLRVQKEGISYDAIDTIIKNKEISIGVLKRYLNDSFKTKTLSKTQIYGPMYALYLLAYFKEPSLFNEILKIFKLDDQKVMELFNHHLFGSDMGRIIARSVNSKEDINLITELLLKKDMQSFRFSFLLDALKSLLVSQRVSYDFLVELLNELLDKYKDNYRVNALANMVVDLGAIDLYKKLVDIGKEIPLSFTLKDLTKLKASRTKEIALLKLSYDNHLFDDLPTYLSLNDQMRYKRVIENEIYGSKVIYKCEKCLREMIVNNPCVFDKEYLYKLPIFKKNCIYCSSDAVPLLLFKDGKDDI